MEKIRFDVGRDGVVVGVGSGKRGRERGGTKTCFLAARAVYVHYLNEFNFGSSHESFFGDKLRQCDNSIIRMLCT